MTVNAKCPYCGKFFKTQYWFNYHIRSCHPASVDASVIKDKQAGRMA